MLFLLSGMIFVTQKSDAQCNSFGIDFKQGANRDNFGSYTTGEIHWINSILQQSNSRYIEGMSTLQRVVFNNLPACSGTHTLRIKLEARKGDVHAYDFLTSWDNALKAAAAIAPGFGLMPSSRSDPKLHECGPAIDACAEVACILVSGGDGVATATDDFRDLPIIFSDYASPTGAGEKNLLIDDGTAVDQNTTRQAIQTYECRYGDNIVIPSGVNAGTYDRSVRVYVDGGFTGANGDANNAVYFVGYGDANPNDGGDTYIYYDIVWSSTSTSVVLEFAAHIAVGVDGLAANNPGGCNVTPLGVGYLLNRGASSISGGPYHVIIEDFIGPDGTSGSACEPNLGNQDNQLQGSEILLIPACNLQGPSAVCANTTATYTATVTNPDNATNAANATYLWEIINSSQSPPAATINPPASGNVPQIVGGQTSTSLSITVNTGGVGTYTVKLTITNGAATSTTDDDITSSCTVTTTVSGGATITCPQNTTVASCSASDITTAFNNWLNSVSGVTGGTATRNPANPVAPGICGGTTSVTWTVTNTCGNQSCTSSFTVSTPSAVILTCAQNTTIAPCTSQGAINTAYANWLASATATGGCNRGSVTNSGGAAPDACAGGTRTVTFTVTSTCETKTCSASFTVTAAPALVLTCAQNTTIAACTSQGAINTAYTNWLASATATGGCNRGSVTNSDGGAPDACAGGTRTVTFTVTSTCETKTCSASFTVNPAPAVVLNCAVNTTVAACTSQAGVNTAYSNWLASASATGGCARGNVTNSGGAAPNACSGGTRTVTFTVTSSCETKTCAASFTVIGDNTPPVITCAANTTVACGTANPTFATPGATDACGTPTVTQLGSDVVAGSCPTTYTRRWIATDACGNTSTCSQTITVPCCSSNCTYTQGYYGQDNDQGNSCDGTTNANNQYGSPTALIDHALLAYGGLLRIGCVGHSVTISTGEAQCVRDMLPGGGNNFVPLSAGDYSICALPDSYIGNNGRINNPLLAQTITLGLNLGINPGAGLGNFALQVNKWLVTADLVECGSTTVKPCTFNCTPNLAIPGQYIWTVATSPYHVTDCRISQALYDALPTKNVAGLYAFANSALCGTALPTGVTLQDISKAVDCINNAFDGCRAFVEWRSGTQPTANSFCTLPSATTPCPITPPARITTVAVAEVSAEQLTVNAYPNPFTDRVRFVVRSKVSGQGSLEIYNMLGQKIETVYNGNIVAERSQTIEYRTSTKLNGGLIYIFRVGDKQATGKLLKIEQ
jgi:hypothetical protein